MDFLVHDYLLRGIVEGLFQPGDQLPSDNDLAEEFSVPRMVVRNVYHRLEEMGYIVSRKGRGRFLRDSRSILNLDLTGAESFTDKIRASGIPLVTRVIRNEADFHDKAAMKLDAGPGEVLWRTDRMRCVDNVPVAIHISWVRLNLFPGLPDLGWETESLFAYFRSCGFEKFSSSGSSLDITLPTFHEQGLLQCPPLVPLLIIESDTLDAVSGKPLQYTRILYRSDCFKYSL